MNELPEADNDLSIRHFLAESGTGESPELLEGLRRLRSFRAAPAPKPTGELAALLAETPVPPTPVPPPRQRPQRHRGLILSFALAGAMAAGTTGVAANNDLRLAADSFCADLIEQVLPGQNKDDEPQPPAQPPDNVPMTAGDAGAETGGAGDAGAEPAVPGTHLPEPAADAGGQGATAAVETPPPADNALPAPAAEPAPAILPETAATPEAPAIPEASAEQPGKSGGEHPSGIHPGQGRPGDGHGHPGRGRYWPGDQGSSRTPGQGRGSDGPAGHSRESAHPNNGMGHGP